MPDFRMDLMQRKAISTEILVGFRESSGAM